LKFSTDCAAVDNKPSASSTSLCKREAKPSSGTWRPRGEGA
jgi:hypothetical protein